MNSKNNCVIDHNDGADTVGIFLIALSNSSVEVYPQHHIKFYVYAFVFSLDLCFEFVQAFIELHNKLQFISVMNGKR